MDTWNDTAQKDSEIEATYLVYLLLVENLDLIRVKSISIQ